MSKKIWIVLAICLTFLSGCKLEQEPLNQWQRIDELFNQWNRSTSPGCALGIIQDGQLVYAKGYGMANLTKKEPIHEHTLFEIASTSKQFTAACIAILEEEGQLSIEDEVQKYIPEFTVYNKPIRIRHLLYHTSGLADYLQWATREDTEQTILQKLQDKPLTHEIGMKYEYTNTGYLLLGFIVRRITGLTLRQYADQHIFKPLGMATTFFNDDISANDTVSSLALGYWEPENGRFAEYMPPINLVGDGGVYTCVQELLAWDRNFYQNRLGKGKQSLIERLLTVGTLDDGSPLGLEYAWGIAFDQYKGRQVILHGGAFYGYRAQMTRLPEECLTVILLANQKEFSPDTLISQVLDILLGNH